MDVPDADELYLDFSAKRLFEASCDGDAGGIRPLVEPESERNLLRIVPRKESYLRSPSNTYATSPKLSDVTHLVQHAS